MVLTTFTLNKGDTQSLSVFDVINQMGFGDGTDSPSISDSNLTNELLKVLIVESVKDLGNNTWEFTGRIPITKLQSNTISELAVYNSSNEMAGKALSPVVVTRTGGDKEHFFTVRVKQKQLIIKMAIIEIKSDKFKTGNNLNDEDADPRWWNLTMDAIINLASVGVAQNAYQTLQANNIFENKDFLGADEFTDSTGTNNTVNTGTTTSIFETDKYQLGYTDEAGAGTLVNPDSFSNPTNAFDGDDNTYAQLTAGTTSDTKEFGETFTNRFIAYTKVKFYYTGTSGTHEWKVESYNGATWDTEDTGTFLAGGSIDYNKTLFLNKNIQSVRVTFLNFSSSTQDRRVHTIEYGDFDTSSVVVCDTGLVSTNSSQETICVYADKTTPTNTSITVDISDGTNTLSAQPVNEALGLPVGWTTGNLEITFNLNTTDTSVTPEIIGYGVYIK